MLASAFLRSPLAPSSNRRCLSHLSNPPPLAPAQPPAHDPVRPPYRVLFFGADSFSCEVFKRVHQARQGLVSDLVVVTPPDHWVGRKNKERHTPALRRLAEELEVPSIALPKTLLKGWQPPELFLPSPPSSISVAPSPQNLLITASFGHLIPTSLLSLFLPLNTLNVHPSLLPKYRGAAPIQWSVMNGAADEEDAMGVTVQELSRRKFDQGRILGQNTVSVPPDADFRTLEPLLARAGGDLLVSVLRDLDAKQAAAIPQDSTFATHARKLTKTDSRAMWAEMSAENLLRLQRGAGHQYPLWTTRTRLSSATAIATAPPSEPTELQLRLSAHLTPLTSRLTYALPGTAVLDPQTKLLIIKCRDGKVGVVVDEVKPQDRGWVKARDWWNGLEKQAKAEGALLE
ncbi:hypothetical protein JCM10213_001405 [Rhodosporidiobolus nylandii]